MRLETQEMVEHYNNVWKRLALSTFVEDLQELGLDKTVREALQELGDFPFSHDKSTIRKS